MSLWVPLTLTVVFSVVAVTASGLTVWYSRRTTKAYRELERQKRNGGTSR